MIRQLDPFQQEFCMLKNAFRYQLLLFVVMISSGEVLPADQIDLETINVSADEAYEDIQPGILHLKGNFQMQSREWKLESDSAKIYGQPDRPDMVFLEGAPARFLITRDNGKGHGTVKAEAKAMKYQRSTNMLELTGGAILKLDDEVIKSTLIKYDIGTNRYWAGGVNGVLINVPPVD